MNRRGYGAVGFLILYMMLIVMCPLVLARLFGQAGQNAVASGATGIEAFMWMNLNLWFGILMLIVGAVYLRFGGGQ